MSDAAGSEPLGSPGGFAATALAGRCALVTGGASGIGRATAAALAGLGARVAIVDRDGDEVTAVAAEIARDDGQVVGIGCDVSELDRIDATVERIVDEVGSLTILVNNAGIVGRPLLETTDEQWNHVIAVNLTAPFALTRAVGRRMIDGRHGGSIVNVSSSSAFRAAPTACPRRDWPRSRGLPPGSSVRTGSR